MNYHVVKNIRTDGDVIKKLMSFDQKNGILKKKREMNYTMLEEAINRIIFIERIDE